MKKMNGEKKKSIKKLAKSARNFKSQKASWRKLCLVLCDDPEGWNGEVGSEVQERIYVYTWLIHDVVQQKLTHCKIIIFQLKKKVGPTSIPLLIPNLKPRRSHQNFKNLTLSITHKTSQA